MTWLWTWGGTCFGYRDGEDLWTYSGTFVGRIDEDDEIFGCDGRYLGEIRNGNRLITNLSKIHRHRGMLPLRGQRGGYARYADYAGYAMYAGCQDFPDPDQF